jgi:hypothetical protein
MCPIEQTWTARYKNNLKIIVDQLIFIITYKNDTFESTLTVSLGWVFLCRFGRWFMFHFELVFKTT